MPLLPLLPELPQRATACSEVLPVVPQQVVWTSAWLGLVCSAQQDSTAPKDWPLAQERRAADISWDGKLALRPLI